MLFGVDDQLRKGEQGPDQRCHRQDLIGSPRQAQRNVQRRKWYTILATDVGQFLDKIEKPEQKQQGGKNQPGRRKYPPRDVTANCLHARLLNFRHSEETDTRR
jgi:hypothetical protein